MAELTFHVSQLGIMLLVMLALWPISVWRNDPSFIDSIWPLGFILMALSSAVSVGTNYLVQPVFWMVLVWGLRLGLHLFTRWMHEGADKRYDALKARARFNVHLFVLVTVFVLQGILLWLTSLPIQNAMVRAEGWAPFERMDGFALAGLALFVVGLLFETIGDWQLARFKANPDNAGKVMDQGLWRYTRHPNYFGDACVFWGIYLVGRAGADPFWGDGAWTIIGPIFLTWTLTRWSGKALLERNLMESRPDYADYVRRTPGFVPGFPKRRDP